MAIKKLPDYSGIVAPVVDAAKQAAGSGTTTYRVGSTGSGVKELQKALVDAGYSVGASGTDGVYGQATAAAVKQYQKDNGLSVDGIAGKNTLGALYNGTSTAGTNALQSVASNVTNAAKAAAGASKNAPAAASETPADTKTETETPADTKEEQPAPSNGFTYDSFSYNDYTPSDVVNQANALLQQHRENQPGAYQSQWQDEINDYLNQIQNRDPFSYDVNSDALYQQYKDNYILQGQMAMMDAMGQASAMTGGYGNSYAQSVGQQAYNQQLNQLNNIVPELYQMAYNRYSDEGQRLMDMYNLYMGQENQDYNRYQTELGNWYTQLDYLTNSYNTERELDYNKYESGRQEAYNEHLSDKDLAWKEYLTNLEKEETAANLMAGIGNYDRLGDVLGLTDEELAAYKEYMNPTKKTSTKTSGGTYSSSIAAEQQKLKDAGYDIVVDGIDGPQTQAARDDYNNKDKVPQLSAAGQSFINNLPYAHAGSGDAWKEYVTNAIDKNSTLSEDDKVAIAYKLGL